ncbi:MAG TPA: CHASE domain-containing protein, partial [Tahibacter sp.]|nr:CHASE domain-containing protein [Tahibacter sp.]
MVESRRRGAAAQRGRYLFAGAVATLVCAVVGIALNVAGIAEWAPTWPALSALLLLGLGLFAERQRRPRLAVALSLPVMLLGAGVLGVALFGLRGALSPHLNSLTALPSNSAAGLLAAALSLALGVRAQRPWTQVVCTLLAAVAVALGTFGLLGRLFGIAPGIGWGSVGSVSVLTGLGLIACGSTLLLQRALGRDGGDPLQRASLLPALFVLALSLGATVMAWRVSAEAARASQHQRFEHQVQQLAAAIEQRLRGYVDALRGAQGLYAASESVEADEWQRYWDQVDLQSRYPAVVGVGYAARIEARERGDFEGAMAVGRRGGFRIWPAGERERYFPVTFLEPAEGANLLLLGYDLGSEPARHEALQRAVTRDEVALSGRINVAGSAAGDTEAGFALYAPLHGGGRRDGDPAFRLLGVAYFDVRAAEWMQLVDSELRNSLRVQLYDGDTEDPAQRLYGDGDLAAPAALRSTSTLDQAGRHWRLVAEAAPEFFAANRSSTPLSVLLAGLLFSLLLFAIAWLLAGLRMRAERLVTRRTAELERSQRAFRALTDTANDAIIAAGDDGTIRYVNPSAERCFGYEADALLQQPLTVLMPERYRSAHAEGMARLLAGGEPHVIGRTVELAGLRRDGSEFPLEISIAHWRSDDG